MATPSPVTSDASENDTSAASHSHTEPEPALSPNSGGSKQDSKTKTKSTAKPRAKRDPEERHQAYLARRREIKARQRSRQKETSSSLKEQHVVLQKQLQAALAKYQTSTREKLREKLSEGQGELLLALWDEYVDALGLHHAITQENKHLVERIDEFLLYECRLLLPEFQECSEAVAMAGMIDAPMLTPEESRTNEQLLREMPTLPQREGMWTQFLDEYDAPFYYELYTEEECNAVLSRYFKMMEKDIHEATTNQWKLTGGCFGWKGYGHIDSTDQTFVRFQFRKTLYRASSSALIDEMRSETFRIFHSPKLYARLYGMRMESQTMQRVNENTSVILQTMSDEHRFLSLRGFMLFTCVEERLPPTQASGGKPRRAVTILNVVIPPREKDVAIPSTDPRKMMLYLSECLIYMRMEQVNNTDVAVYYGGHANCLSPELARMSVLESVSSFFRWVQQVIPERLLAFE